MTTNPPLIRCPISALIVWDGAAQHRSRVVREYLDSTRGAVQMALLPGYAPDLNPVEYLWA